MGIRNGLYWIIHLKVIVLGVQDMSSQTSSSQTSSLWEEVHLYIQEIGAKNILK